MLSRLFTRSSAPVSAAALAAVAGLALPAAAQIIGPSTATVPYMLPSDPSSGTRVISIATNGNGTGGVGAEFYNALDFNNNVIPGQQTQLLGIPDGLGAFDNGDGTFTLLVNHELPANTSTAHAHGSRGAVVSRWIVSAGGNLTPSTLSSNDFRVVGARDANLQYNLYTTAPFSRVEGGSTVNYPANSYVPFDAARPMPQYNPGNTFGIQGWNTNNPNRDGTGRYCSSDLAPTTAYQWTDPTSGQTFGTADRILLNGEEIGSNGRAFAHVVTGNDRNQAFELPRLGHISWENALASPLAQRQTIVAGLDDSGTGNLLFYVGNKQNTGNAIERAGLTNGNAYGLQISDLVANVESASLVLPSTSAPTVARESARFGLHNFGDVTNVPGSTIGSTPGIQQIGDANQVTNFARLEDGAWDPASPNKFYFLTTGSIGQPSRIWAAEFDDIRNPTAGGTVRMLGDGQRQSTFSGGFTAFDSGDRSGVGVTVTGRATTMEMADNMCAVVGRDGVTRLLIQEDVGGSQRLGRLWLYDTVADSMKEVGINNIRFFGSTSWATGSQVTNFLTLDEETSGIIPAPWLGEGWFLLDMQAHYGIAGELVEGGQLMAIYIPETIPTPGGAAVLGLGAFAALRRRRHR